MKVVKTARQNLGNYARCLDFTLEIYRDAVEFVNKIVYMVSAFEICPGSKGSGMRPKPLKKQVMSRILKAYVSGGALPASFGIDALSLRQTGSPLKLML